MRDIVTAQEMKDLDRNTIENAGVLSLVLMERAALKTVEEMKKRWKQEDRERFWWYAEAAITAETDWRLQGCFIFRAFQSVFISREKKKR